MKQNLRDRVSTASELHPQLSLNLKQLISKLNSNKEIHELKLGVFSPYEQEPLWFFHFDAKTVGQYLMVHMHDSRKLSYHSYEFEEIKSGNVGFKLPRGDREQETPDIIIIPGLAYTKKLERLGRGKGYFDSYLETFKGIKIGVFFSMQEVESVYSEEHDQLLDYIVTEKEILIRGI